MDIDGKINDTAESQERRIAFWERGIGPNWRDFLACTFCSFGKTLSVRDQKWYDCTSCTGKAVSSADRDAWEPGESPGG
jgi:hypothetical protein